MAETFVEEDILIEPDGTIRFVYSDALAAAFDGETIHTVRASHVEPHPCYAGWLADMRPVGGPVIGSNGQWPGTYADGGTVTTACLLRGFATRQEALDAERVWIRKEMGL